MKKNIILIITITAVATLLQWSRAQSPEEAVNLLDNEDGVGARAMGMGNAFNAVADDYTAAYWNPAGLAQLDYNEFSANLSNLRFENEALFHNTSTLDNRNWAKLHSLGLAYKFPTTRGSAVISLGYNRFKNYNDFLSFNGFNRISNGLEFELEDEFGQYQYYSFDRDVQQNETVSQDGSLGAWTLAGGMQLSPNFSVGLAFNIYSGKSEYLLEFSQEDVDDIYTQFPGNFSYYEYHDQLKTDIYGWGVKLGSLIKVTPQLNLGLTIEFPTTLNVKETWSRNDLLEFDDGYISDLDLGKGEWEYLVTYPYKFSAGASFNLHMFKLAASMDYRDWTQVRFDIPDGYAMDENYSALLDQNQQFPEQFREVFSYAVGGEARIPGSPLLLRGGYRFVPSPFRDTSLDLDRNYYSAGLGYDIDEFTSLDVGLTWGKIKRQSVDDFTPGGTDESITTTRVMAGVTFRL